MRVDSVTLSCLLIQACGQIFASCLMSDCRFLCEGLRSDMTLCT